MGEAELRERIERLMDPLEREDGSMVFKHFVSVNDLQAALDETKEDVSEQRARPGHRPA